MAFVSTDTLIGYQPIDQASTTQQHPLNTIIQAQDNDTYGGGEFQYARANGAITEIGFGCILDEGTGDATPLTNNAQGSVGVSMTTLADNEYGWFQVDGKAIASSQTASDGDTPYISSIVTGDFDDNVFVGDRVKRAKYASGNFTHSSGNSVAEMEIHRPFVDNGAAA